MSTKLTESLVQRQIVKSRQEKDIVIGNKKEDFKMEKIKTKIISNCSAENPIALKELNIK